ncbi:hypothetical protein JG687_00002959, partial [Phytophthora cactorum]
TSASASAAKGTTAPDTPGPAAQISPDPASSGSGSATAIPPGSSAGSGSAAPIAPGSGTDGSLETSEPPSTVAPTPAPKPSGPAVQLSETFGGPHGNEFSDQPAAVSGQTITSLTVRGAARIDGLTLEVSAPTAQTFTH